MASISDDGNGFRRLLFTRPMDGRRVAIRLGKVSARIAGIVLGHVEQLVGAAIKGVSASDETSRWLSTIGESLHASLAEHGLIPARRRVQLGVFLQSYIDSRKDVGPGTATNYGTVQARILDFFEPERLIHEITPGDAHAWLVHLRSRSPKYAEATIGKTIKTARQFFLAALRSRLITQNPFESLKAPKQTNDSKLHFVSREIITRVIAEAPDAEWRLIIALSRFGGLRCPSEHLALTWDDVNWEQDRIRVDSPKSGERWFPIFPDLRTFLTEAFEHAKPGQVYMIARYRKQGSNLRTQFRKMMRRAGVKPWPRTFHNLRATRETELCEIFPLHVVAKWLGNSPKTASAHYLQVTDEHFRRGAAAQNCAQDPTKLEQTMQTSGVENIGKTQEMAENGSELVTPTDSELISISASHNQALRPEPISPGAQSCALLPIAEWELFKRAWLAGDIE